MFTVRRVGWTLTGLVILGLVVVFVLVIQTTDATPTSLLQIYRSPIGLGLIWIALWLIALTWIVLRFGRGLVAGLRGEEPGSPNHRAARLEARPPRA